MIWMDLLNNIMQNVKIWLPDGEADSIPPVNDNSGAKTQIWP